MAVKGWPRSLSWGEFRQVPRPPAGEKEQAQTEATMAGPERVGVARDGNQAKLATVEVTVKLVRNGTWIVKGAASASLLAHEQLHWDIAGLTAWELHRFMEAARAADPASLSDAIQRELARLQAKADALQEKYDKQSEHSRNAKEQSRWATLVRGCIGNNNRALPDP